MMGTDKVFATSASFFCPRCAEGFGVVQAIAISTHTLHDGGLSRALPMPTMHADDQQVIAV